MKDNLIFPVTVVLVVAAMLITAAPVTSTNTAIAASYMKLDERLNKIDNQQLLSAFEWLKANGFDKELLRDRSDTMQTAGYGGGFVLILVLFILLVIIGAGFGY